MSAKRVLLTVLAASAVLWALGIGSQMAGAWPPAQQPIPSGITIPYPGRLSLASPRDASQNGAVDQAVPDGTYDFTFTLYNTETGGAPLWSETQNGVSVQGGAFQAMLGAGRPIPPTALDGGDRWLEVAVRGPGEASFTALAPRQRLTATAPTVPESASAGSSCPHDHWGEDWSGSGSGLSIQSYDSIAVSAIGLSGSILPVPPSGKYGIYAYGETSGVYGTGAVAGVEGYSHHLLGVHGESYDGNGVYGESQIGDGVVGHSDGQHGVYGSTDGDWGNRSGVYGLATNDHAHGVTGWNTSAGPGVYGRSVSGHGVYGYSASGYGVYGYSDSSYAGYFNGQVYVVGYLWKPGGGFKIDHPLDPENQYLNHSFVESPDMKNVYDGVVELDANGEAWVELPAWFEALNKDFRYQLTPIGAPGPNLYIAQEVQDNRFQIAGGTPGMKVSWQVTGIRHDAYAEAHPIPVEEDKPPEEQGTYLHPIEYGKPETMGVDYQQEQGLPQAGGGR
jgi:hypothetical protein